MLPQSSIIYEAEHVNLLQFQLQKRHKIQMKHKIDLKLMNILCEVIKMEGFG
jgi:hypothetical protein